MFFSAFGDVSLQSRGLTSRMILREKDEDNIQGERGRRKSVTLDDQSERKKEEGREKVLASDKNK